MQTRTASFIGCKTLTSFKLAVCFLRISLQGTIAAFGFIRFWWIKRESNSSLFHLAVSSLKCAVHRGIEPLPHDRQSCILAFRPIDRYSNSIKPISNILWWLGQSQTRFSLALISATFVCGSNFVIPLM